MKSITRKQLNAIMNGWSIFKNERAEWGYEEIERWHHRGDTERVLFVFTLEGKIYQGVYSISESWGIDTSEIDLLEVEKYQTTVVVTKYRMVNHPKDN